MHRHIRVPLSSCATVLLLAACSSDLGGPESGPDVILIQPSSVTLLGGESLYFRATATGNGSELLRASDVVWSSSDPRVAKVSSDGLVKGGVAGTVAIQAWWNGVRGSATVVVLEETHRNTKCPAALAAGHADSDCRAD